jgi:hypothetical protein
MWPRNGRWILPEMPDFHLEFRDLLHTIKLRHGTDGFTSPPKEGVLRIFLPWKIRRLRPVLNPRTWVPKASTLPLDHRSPQPLQSSPFGNSLLSFFERKWKTEERRECANMGKVKWLELRWQLYVTWLPERDVLNIRPTDFCSTECTTRFNTKKFCKIFA